MRMNKLDSFLRANRITGDALAEYSGKSARAISLARNGQEPTLRTMKAIAAGCSAILRREVTLDELFDLSVPKRGRKAA